MTQADGYRVTAIVTPSCHVEDLPDPRNEQGETEACKSVGRSMTMIMVQVELLSHNQKLV